MAPETGNPRRKILYSFYNKPMAAKIMMLSTSAIQENTKVATVSEEIHRRLKKELNGFKQITCRGDSSRLHG